jgi:hypothetical protein
VTTTAPPAEAEIGWTEVDDTSPVGLAEGDEVREYSFEEADAATLAELGLVQPGDTVIVVPVDEPAVEEAPKPRRGRKPAAAATEASPDAKATEPAKPRRSRGRASSSRTPASEVPASNAAKPRGRAAKATDDAAAATEPKPRTRSRAKPAAETAPAEGAEEGIWQRFRGARTKAP